MPPVGSESLSLVAAAPGPSNTRRWTRLAGDIAQPVAALIIFVALWELICRGFAVPAYLVPAPSAIWTDTLKLAGPVSVHTLATTQTVLLGFLASLVVSLPLAVLITASPVIANTVYPFLVLTQSIPKVALAPILVVIFGSNELPRVVVTFLVAFFPLVLSIAAGAFGFLMRCLSYSAV
jgi:NitT/TauT family transport system permease protein